MKLLKFSKQSYNSNLKAIINETMHLISSFKEYEGAGRCIGALMMKLGNGDGVVNSFRSGGVESCRKQREIIYSFLIVDEV